MRHVVCAFVAAALCAFSMIPRDANPALTLANGEPITEHNVMAALYELKSEYPTGTIWGRDTTPDTLSNPNPLSVVTDQVLLKNHHIDPIHACGGYAAMVSDRIFGTDNHCVKTVDVADVRPGDIIVALDADGEPAHVMISLTRAMTPSGRVRATDGNVGERVKWPEPDRPNDKQPGENGDHWVVYTRYP